MRLAVAPAPNEHTDLLAPHHKLDAAMNMCLCPNKHLAQNAGVHVIEDD